MNKHMTSKLIKIILVIGVVVYVNNASWFRALPGGEVTFLAHRGIHQNYSKEGLERDSCTAIRIDEPKHDFLENTVRSIGYAFSLGANIVEIDIHPTTDGKFAVFHDWTIDCRTNGKGVTRKQSLTYLKTLDIGYGYTHDGGKTFPFRGKGVGQIPSLTEVLNTFPDKNFLVNIKSNSVKDADLINRFLENRPKENLDRLWFYGGVKPTSRLFSLKPELKGFDKPSVKKCLLQYELIGWSGYVPEICRNTIVLVPMGYSKYLWGWPRVFVSRMNNVNTDIILVDMSNGNKNIDGVDDPQLISILSENYRGIIWTDKIEQVGDRSSK